MFLLLLTACKETNRASTTDVSDLSKTSEIPATTINTANVFVKWGNSSDTLNSCIAWLNNKEIRVSLFEQATGQSFDFPLQNYKDGWKISGSIAQPSVTDCLFVASQFRVLQQRISFDKQQYKNGDELQGKIDLILLGRKGLFRKPLVPFKDTRKWDSIFMNGSFTVKLN